ncbi:hypothetical protein SAMN02745195_01671 [Thermoanaerobacter uzonensis DSM 18761]|jgi:hypothetical protein|uniref:Uncharacterized protein n=1 Tax=Thermoanaerobacter uzonensis DSM 18761 TaxID=1123369 RepID=A0A1M4YAZ4_9THEO|nr:hypothetical protein [Thermoanaerobacter uzonensis]SHF02944.1 hypothetical protein SAMN02745195_01671 [Thermoanaerobacter uzonensis DSM 18761]
MVKNFPDSYKRYFSLISIFFILILILPGCNIHKNNDEPGIANSIKTKIGNYDTAKKLEKNNFYSLALVKYQLSYIFATLSKDWMEYPDIIHYGDLKANDVSAESIIRSWNDSVKEFEEIDKKLVQYEKEGKAFLNIRLVIEIFYKSWFNVGDGYLRRFIETQSNWREIGNIAYMNIGPVPFALKMITEDLKSLSTKLDDY